MHVVAKGLTHARAWEIEQRDSVLRRPAAIDLDSSSTHQSASRLLITMRFSLFCGVNTTCRLECISCVCQAETSLTQLERCAERESESDSLVQPAMRNTLEILLRLLNLGGLLKFASGLFRMEIPAGSADTQGRDGTCWPVTMTYNTNHNSCSDSSLQLGMASNHSSPPESLPIPWKATAGVVPVLDMQCHDGAMKPMLLAFQDVRSIRMQHSSAAEFLTPDSPRPCVLETVGT